MAKLVKMVNLVMQKMHSQLSLRAVDELVGYNVGVRSGSREPLFGCYPNVTNAVMQEEKNFGIITEYR